jgi:hypothetical protein
MPKKILGIALVIAVVAFAVAFADATSVYAYLG